MDLCLLYPSGLPSTCMSTLRIRGYNGPGRTCPSEPSAVALQRCGRLHLAEWTGRSALAADARARLTLLQRKQRQMARVMSNETDKPFWKSRAMCLNRWNALQLCIRQHLLYTCVAPYNAFKSKAWNFTCMSFMWHLYNLLFRPKVVSWGSGFRSVLSCLILRAPHKFDCIGYVVDKPL